MSSENSSANRNSATEIIRVGGITPFTTIDYPGQLAAVLFLQGCPWRCHYCHNRELLGRYDCAQISWSSVLEFLHQRKNLIDAIVFSGGEPSLQSGLAQAMQQVKDMGFKIGLHSAGTYPDRLRRLLPLVDWIGLDIKAAPNRYARVTGVRGSGQRAWESLRLVVESNLDYEIRTTVHPRLMGRDELLDLVDALNRLEVSNYAIQECVSAHCANPDYRVAEAFPLSEPDICDIAGQFRNFVLRKAA